jgi:hypothetical protein
MNQQPDDATLAEMEIQLAVHLVPLAVAGINAERQIIEAENNSRPVWTFTTAEQSAVELIETRHAVDRFPPSKWWRQDPHPG